VGFARAWPIVLSLLAPGQGSDPAGSVRIDAAALIRDVERLAAPEMEGRRPGTAGHARARRYIADRFRAVGLEPIEGSFERPFAYVTRGIPQHGVNFVGLVPGTDRGRGAIVVTAHYDHLGVVNDRLFDGANDNASGTAALFALAQAFVAAPARHTLVFAALDAEETGLHGARALLASPPVPLDAIVLNVNLDMIGRDHRNTLYAAGARHYPALKGPLERVAATALVDLRLGHDGPGAPAIEDWTRESDHFAFHERGIPFVYFGVEDAAEHHRDTDEPWSLTRGFYIDAVITIARAIRELDQVSW